VGKSAREASNQKEKVSDIGVARRHIDTAFDVSGRVGVTAREKDRLAASIQDTITLFGRLNSIDLSRFRKVVDSAYGSAVNTFTGEEAKLFQFVRKVVDNFDKAGAAYEKFSNKLTTLSGRTAKVRDVAATEVGRPVPTPSVAPKKSRELETKYFKSLHDIADITVDLKIEDSQFDSAMLEAISLAKKGRDAIIDFGNSTDLAKVQIAIIS
jgi:hypothetical protein